MWLSIVICGAVAYNHVIIMFCLFGSPLLGFFLLSPHYLHSSPSISRRYPILHLAQGRKEDEQRHLDCLFKRISKLVNFSSYPTDRVALDTGTSQRVLPPEIERLNILAEKKKNLYILFFGKTVRTASSGIIHILGANLRNCSISVTTERYLCLLDRPALLRPWRIHWITWPRISIPIL